MQRWCRDGERLVLMCRFDGPLPRRFGLVEFGIRCLAHDHDYALIYKRTSEPIAQEYAVRSAGRGDPVAPAPQA